MSDWAATFLMAAFPDLYEFNQDNRIGTVSSIVVDKGLESLIGKTIDLNFDFDSWFLLKKNTNKHREYIIDQKTTKPILFSYEYGEGLAVFTSFHNHSQASETEKKLLEFLVLKSLTKSSIRFSNLTQTELDGVVDIPLITTNKEKRSGYFDNDKIQDISFILNWSDRSARFGLYVWNPSGKLVKNVESENAYCAIQIINAESGRWEYTIVPISVPYVNYPFNIIVGPTESIQKILPSGN